MKKVIAVLGAVALTLLITTGAFAANKMLTGANIKNGSIGVVDLSKSAKAALKGQPGEKGATGDKGETGAAGLQGPAGAAGANGAAGAQGPKGQDGVGGYEVRTWRYSKDDANSDMGPGYVGVGSGAIATVACSPGKVALGGGYWFTSPDNGGFNAEQALTNGSGVTASFPGRMDWTTNTVKPGDNSGWIVQVNKNVQSADMTLYVICANAS